MSVSCWVTCVIWRIIVSAVIDVIFFFNDTATTEIYTLSLHDALPICCRVRHRSASAWMPISRSSFTECWVGIQRSEEHTSELQSQFHLVCRLLLEKKKKKTQNSQCL